MAIIKHPFQSAKVDGSDPTQVQPSHWNEDHTVEMAGPGLLGRVSGAGAVQEIVLGDNLSFSGGVLNAAGGGGGGSSLGSANPQDLGVAAPGTSALAAREDHTHKVPTLVELGAAPASHGHDIGVVTGLQTALDGKATAAQGAKADTAVQPAGLTKGAVGLGSVDNTSDVDKPISTATQTALNGKTPTGHIHVFGDITGLVSALAGKAQVSHQHVAADITDLAQYLDEKDLYTQTLGMPAASTLAGTEQVAVIQNDVAKVTTVDGILARSGVMVSTKNVGGDWTGMARPGGGVANDLIVISASEPVNEDGRPNGTIYIKVA